MILISKIFGSIEPDTIHFRLTGISSHSTKVFILIGVIGITGLIIDGRSGDHTFRIDLVIADLHTPVLVCDVDPCRIIAIFSSIGTCPETVFFHVSAQEVTSIDEVIGIRTPRNERAGNRSPCPFHDSGLKITADIDQMPVILPFSIRRSIERHIPHEARQTGRCQPGSDKHLPCEIAIPAFVVEFLRQRTECILYGVLTARLDAFAVCSRDDHGSSLCRFDMGISALVVIDVGSMIIMCVADDVRAAVVIDGQPASILTHRNEAIHGDFFRAVV